MLNGETARRSRVSALAAETLMNNAGETQSLREIEVKQQHGR